MTRSLAVVLSVLVLGAGATACDDAGGNPFVPGPQACTAIGCESTLTFQLSEADLQPDVAYEVEVCVDLDCTRTTVQATGEPTFDPITVDVVADQVVLTGLEGDLSGDHEVSLAIRDEAGTAIATASTSSRFQRNQPNGEGCPPICWSATIDV